MNSIKLGLLFIPLVLIGCIASKQGNASVSKKLAFIKENFRYDAAHKMHRMEQPLIDSFVSQNRVTFDVLVGFDSNKVKSVLGSPDLRESPVSFEYKLGKCPPQLKCNEMFLNITFSKDGICDHTFFETKIENGVSPNNGIQR
ncbi:MAG: hypothetical protein JWO03_1273 [Bacteroidetes bacterium]|nr:hypothetical protein [Bacteroidota bacterium]